MFIYFFRAAAGQMHAKRLGFGRSQERSDVIEPKMDAAHRAANDRERFFENGF